MQKHLFILAPGMFCNADPDEVAATCDGLVEMDLFHLPYEHVWIQLPANECFCNEERPQDKLPPEVTVMIGPLSTEKTTNCDVLCIDSRWGGCTLDLVKDYPKLIPALRPLIDDVAYLLITLLATRNIVKTEHQNKLAKLGIGLKKAKRNPARGFAYTTTISLPQDLPDHEGHAIGKSKCPHLRRGHIRNQHYGPANSYVKKIWIEPMFVNADPSFVSKREAYNVSLPIKELV